MTDRDKGSIFDEWKKRQDQLKQEESARERARQQSQLSQAQSQAERNVAEQARRLREAEKGGQTLQELEQEFRQQQLDRLAEEIKNSVWGNTQGVAITLTKISIPDVTEFNDGTYRNRSLVGVKLSYSYEDVLHWSREDYIPNDEGAGITNVVAGSRVEIARQEFSLGIGYFGEYGKTMVDKIYYPEGLPKDKSALEGIKSYYIRRPKSEMSSDERYRVTHVYPYEYRDAFINRLNDLITPLSPDTVIPQARERVIKWNDEHKPPPAQQPQQGFFRRLFRKG